MKEPMKTNNKQLKREYKQGIRPMGVFQIRNLANEKIFVASGINLAGTINRHRFQLGAGVHQNPQLQLDWNNQGAGSFAFEILDQMNPADDPRGSRRDLEVLEDIWLKKLKPFEQQGYNIPAKRIRHQSR
jgi:nitrate/nitrite-specific signal transduction histidine kinase